MRLRQVLADEDWGILSDATEDVLLRGRMSSLAYRAGCFSYCIMYLRPYNEHCCT